MGDSRLRFLFLESYYGGSHQEFADGLCERSSHDIVLVTLADRFWKWRMRGAALHFAGKVDKPEQYDGVIVTSLLSLADLRGIWGDRCPPVIVYFHENQMTYPVRQGGIRDVQFGFSNISTALAADRVVFNSRFHLDEFLEGVESLVRQMPDYRPRWVRKVIADKATVLHPGCRLRRPSPKRSCDGGPPLIVWNHRWEFDKVPEAFFGALDRVLAEGLAFRLALLGENFQVVPTPFLDARDRYGDRIVQYGFVPSRAEYLDWLARGDIVVSTAIQENFGISVVEAIAAGCFPLLPNRLSYPEVLPAEFHTGSLYTDTDQLAMRLGELLADPPPRDERLMDLMWEYSWDRLIGAYDTELESLAARA